MTALEDALDALDAAIAMERQALEVLERARDDARAALAQLPAPNPDPVPVPVPVPNLVRVGSATYPLAGVNPVEAAGRPGGRGANELIAVTAPATVTPTNEWGAEVPHRAGAISVPVNDRQATRTTTGLTGTPVPADGGVLSGHGTARDWLLRYAAPGAVVVFTRVDRPEATWPGTPEPTPTPDPDPDPVPAGAPVIALFRKDGSGSTARIPAGVNQFLYSFFQGTGLVEWGGETLAVQSANLSLWLNGAPGRRQVLIAVGGAKGTVNPADRGRFIAGFMTAEKQFGDRVSGIVWDIEGAAMVPADVVAISKALASGREDRYTVGFSPPGGDPVPRYLEAAVACHRAGLSVWFGSQLYEAPKYITEAEAIAALQRYVDAGLPPSRVVLGTMVGSDQRHWTIDMCEQVLKAAVRRWPDFGGCYLWSEGQEAQDAEWARRMAEVLVR